MDTTDDKFSVCERTSVRPDNELTTCRFFTERFNFSWKSWERDFWVLVKNLLYHNQFPPASKECDDQDLQIFFPQKSAPIEEK